MQFNYDDWSKQQAARKAAQGNGSKDLPKTRFINEFLKNDGDSVVVRFPYNSMADVKYETTHSVKFPGDNYEKRVRCEGKDCPLCKEGLKLDTRFFVKALVYVQNNDTNTIDIIPAIWDRSAAFADIDLKERLEECKEDDLGLLSENLVKIKRSGSGLNTRYTSKVLSQTNTIYNSKTCPSKLELLDAIDPAKIMSKSVEQYMAALNPDAVPTNTIAVSKPAAQEEEVEEAKPAAQEEVRRTSPTRYAF